MGDLMTTEEHFQGCDIAPHQQRHLSDHLIRYPSAVWHFLIPGTTADCEIVEVLCSGCRWDLSLRMT
jgi:hypothetical protein